MSDRIAHTLGKSLDWEVRQHFVGAYEAMWRDLDFAIQKRKPEFRRAMARGWTPERLRVLCVLSAFTRTVLGPLSSAMGRRKGHILGRTRPVKYGRLVTVDDEANEPVQAALDAFELLCRENGIYVRWLHANRIADIVYFINRHEDGEGP